MRTYTLERDIQPPHLALQTKACKRCSESQPNTFQFFPKIPFRTQRYGPRHTTGDVCKSCVGRAMSEASKNRRRKSLEADELMMKDLAEGRYLK